MRTPFRGLLAFLIFALLLAACAPANSGSQATATTVVEAPTEEAETEVATEAPTETTAAEMTPTAEGTAEVTKTPADGAATATTEPTPTITPLAAVEGTLTIWADETRVETINALGQQFTEQYNVPVAVQQMGFGDIRDQLKIAGPAGEGPDIIIGAHDWLGELVSNGLLEPLDLGDNSGSFDPVSIQAFTYNGELYGMPYAVESVALIYNKDLVPTPPTTWDELMTVAQQLQDEGKVDQAYVLQQGDPYHTNPFFTAFGGYVFGQNEDGTYNPEEVGLDNEGSLKAAAMLDQMVKDGLLRKDVNYDVMLTLFNQGKSAMMIGGPWMLPDIRAAGINYGIATIPAGDEPARPFVGVQGFMVSSFAKNKLLATSFLNEYIATDEAMQSLYEADPRGPAWTPLRDTIDDEDLVAFSESAAQGQPMPAIPEMSAVWEAWTKALTLIFQQQQDSAQAMKDAAETIRSQIAGSE